jgi:hypothetical protein
MVTEAELCTPLRLSPEARQRLLAGRRAMAEIIASIVRVAEAQDDERLIELIWQARGEFVGFLRTAAD